MSKTLPLKPRLSEKNYGLASQRVYVVEVPTDANKHTVARAVEAQFEVKVTKVNILNIAGKTKRVYNLTGKRTRNATGRRSDIRKAYITLAEGHSLPFFAGVEEAEQQEQAAQEQFDKAAAKQAGKEAKPTRRGLRRKNTDEEAK